MSSSTTRRPPPLPPKDTPEPVPPPLPSRPSGNKPPEPVQSTRSLPSLPANIKTFQGPPQDKTVVSPKAENAKSNQKNAFLLARESFKELGHHISGSVKSLPLGKPQTSGKDRKISLPQFPVGGSLANKDVKGGDIHRRVTAGDSPFHPMEEDDTYEQPSPSSDIGVPARLVGTNSSSIQRTPSDDNSDPDWSDSEWDDISTVDPPFVPQSDDTYLTPNDTGMIQDDYTTPDEIQMPSKETFKQQSFNAHAHQVPAIADPPVVPSPVTGIMFQGKVTTNGSREDKKKNAPFKPFEPIVPKPPHSKINLADQNKPIPNPKPLKPVKPSDPVVPELPQRPTKEKPLPMVPPVQPFGSVGIASRGSPSSESATSPSNLEKVTEKIAGNKHKEEEPTSSATEAPIYDDGASEILSSFDWFHGELEREEGARRVKRHSENGTFLIRASKTDGTSNSHPYTLVVTLDRKVYNLKIRLRPDRRFAIGNYKPEEVAFDSVPELVEYHKENNIKLTEGGAVRLTVTPRK